MIKRKMIFSTLMMGVLFLVSSCVNDDDFLQEGMLRISFNSTEVTNAKTHVDVMDIADREHTIVQKESVGTRPIEIKLNTGNYLVRIMTDSKTSIQGIQIQKDKVSEIVF